MTQSAPASPPSSLKTALIVDDHPLFCDALALTLNSIARFDRIDTADRLQDALDKIQNNAPDLVVLDLNLPDVDGLEGLVRIKTAAPRTPVIVVSSMADNRMIAHTLRAGAAGFVPKHSQRSVFRQAYEAIRVGDVFKPEGFIDAAEGEPRSAPDDALERLSTLTNQQSRILQLICEGKLNKQIAYDLTIAETTVKAHVTAIMRKLGVQSRTQAVLVAQDARFAKLLPES